MIDEHDKNLLKRSAYAIADSTASSIPGVAQAWALSKALYGNALELRQQKVLEWVEAVQRDPSAFNENVVRSEEFQDGFIAGLEDYIKLRDSVKRRIALRVFKGFALSDDKVEFPLERYNDTLRKISPASLRALAFIKYSILPVMEVKIGEELKKKSLGTEKPFSWWYERELSIRPFSEYDESGYLRSATDQLAELEFLGLVRKVSAYPGGLAFSTDGIVSGWALTQFAYEFVTFIEKDDTTE